MKICKSCANEIEDSATICRYCGANIEVNNTVVIEEETRDENRYQADSEKPEFINNGLIRGPYQKWISLTLCILLGWLGGHKFYEGKYFMGIFYALTFGCWGIGVILDFINLIGKKKYYYVSRIPFMVV